MVLKCLAALLLHCQDKVTSISVFKIKLNIIKFFFIAKNKYEKPVYISVLKINVNEQSEHINVSLH